MLLIIIWSIKRTSTLVTGSIRTFSKDNGLVWFLGFWNEKFQMAAASRNRKGMRLVVTSRMNG
jgi:hypothetical protein